MAAEPLRLSFDLVWQQNLGPRYDDALFRWAVCRDGSSYFTDAKGRLAILNAEGRVLYDSARHSELLSTVAIACDPEGRFSAANERRVMTFAFDGSRVQLVSEIDIRAHRVRPSRLLVPPSGEFVLTGFRDGASYIHVVRRDGSLARSFGEPPAELNASLARESARRASIAWDLSGGRLIYIPMSHFDVRAYALDGQLLKRCPAALAGFRQPSPDILTGRARPGGEVFYAAALPDGSLAVQAALVTDGPARKPSQKLTLALLDRELQVPFARVLDASMPGILQGASADGTLYFMSITPQQGIQLRAGRLME
ncbi:MAG: hypothetical protein SFV54_05370 [Bryobacteraceae bacterium]|nr:hypothetical protein [Bryobacteraceae bacterium]